MVPPADLPAPMTAEAKMEDAKLLPGAQEQPAKAAAPAGEEEATKVVTVVSEEETKKKPEEDQQDPKAAVEKGEEGKEKEAMEEGKEKKAKEAAVVQKSSSYKEESNFLSDLKEHERKALIDLRAMVEEAILGNKLFPVEEAKGAEKDKKGSKEEAKSGEQSNAEVGKEEGSKEEAKSGEQSNRESKEETKSEEKATEEAVKEKEESKDEAEMKVESKEEAKWEEHSREVVEKKEESKGDAKPEEHTKEEAEKMDESKEESKLEEKTKEAAEKEDDKEEAKSEERTKEEAEKVTDVVLWGVPLLGSKGSEGTDVILLKFLRAREFKAKEAFEMLRSTLQWRKDGRIDSILEEESLGEGLEAAAYMDGADREGHPVCYNVYGVFQDPALYERAFGSEEKVERFLRWRFQLTEKGIQKLDLRPGGVASILQITDLKDSPGISKREIRAAMKRAVGLLQDNYPEFVAKNIFINVPFWYYAFNSLLSPFLTQRTKSKFVFARSARVTETLLKYIPAEDIPVHYGGLKRENDTEFSVLDGGVSELIVKSGSIENVEIPIPEAGTTVVWDLTVVGWEVNYKEEFVPTDEGSYTILLQKGKKMGPQEEPARNSFRNSEPGKVVLIIENNTFWKKKVLYRYKVKASS